MIDAKEYLKWIGKQDKLIQGKLAEINQLESYATSIRSLSTNTPVQASHEGDSIGKKVADIIDKINEYGAMVKEWIAEKENRIKMLEQLEDGLQYTVLHKCYVQYKSLKEIANEEHYSYTWISEHHKDGLNNLQKILEKKNSV